MAAPLPDWVDEDRPAPASTPRRAALLGLAALPWLVVVALLVAPRADTTTPEPSTHDEPHPVAGADDHTDALPSPPSAAPPPRESPATGDPPGPSAEALAGWEVTELRGNWRVAPGDGETAALATVVARAWLTGVPPTLPIAGLAPDRSTTYAEHLVVEAIERPSAGAAVVTLLAVLLDTDGNGASGDARIERLAVPLVEDAQGPRPAGTPWLLPGPDTSLAALVTEEVADPALEHAALDALHAAGYGAVELLTLARGDAWPWVVSFRPADGDEERSVWLRRHLDGFALAGRPLPSAATTPEARPDDGDGNQTDETEEVAP